MSGQRKALIVANDQYEQEALRDLLAPGADAEALARVLGDPQIGEFSVQVVRNEPSYVIQAQLEELFSESRPDDVLLIHFSGHGLKSESGALYFAASNTRPNRLGSTAVPADFVQRCMRDSRSRSIVVLLDCCYGGAFAQGVAVRGAGDVNVLDSFPTGRQGGGRGRAVITASNAMEYAFEGEQLTDDRRRRPSVFTRALVEGLATGDADRNEDGWVSLDELYDYVFDKVREQNPHQTPSRQIELEGELYLARSRRLRIRPAPLPPDLQGAVGDPNMYTRLGAISELRSRLLSEDLPVAAGAYQALADLARNDIRAVAEPAAAAVKEAVVCPEQTELHFGEIEQGSSQPRQVVRLLGPPIARACTPRASDDWIHVADTPGGFDISVDTEGVGVRHGSLALSGPTGEALIAIDVELLAPRQEAADKARQAAEREAADKAQQAAEREAAEKARQLAELDAADKARQAAEREAADKARQAAERDAAERDAAERARADVKQALPLDHEQVSVAGESPSASDAGQAAALPTERSSIRKATAATGVTLVVLSSIAGIIQVLRYSADGTNGASTALGLLGNLVPIAVALALLILPKHRLATLGLLQGMMWLLVAYVVWDISFILATHLTGYDISGFVANTISNVLGAIAAVFLLVSWRSAAERRRGSMRGALPRFLLCTVGLSLIADAVFQSAVFTPHGPYYATTAMEIVAGLAVTWYAMSLRVRVLGGALALGWVINAALVLLENTVEGEPVAGVGRVAVAMELVLLATAGTLAVIYIRQPIHDESPNPPVVTEVGVGGAS